MTAFHKLEVSLEDIWSNYVFCCTLFLLSPGILGFLSYP